MVTFGDQVAGLVLELVKKMAAELGTDIDEEACNQIKNHTYVDDGAGGGSREAVERFRGQRVNGVYDGTLARILSLVNLNLKVMVASGDSDPEVLALLGEKVLGHTWRPTSDEFVFKVSVNLSVKKRGRKTADDLTIDDIPRLPDIPLTKRILLGIVMGQYDPIGLICLLIIILKIQLRELFDPEANLDWDDPLPDKLRGVWINLLSMLIQMGEIIVHRSVRPSGVEEVPELIGFGDGSLSAYACAIYVRWKLLKTLESDPDQFDVRLVCAKARVAPVKGITAPRSEISGFLILTRLLKVLVNAMEVKPSRITIAVDSQCTISALEKSGGILAPYFAARVSESMTNLAEVAEDIPVDPEDS